MEEKILQENLPDEKKKFVSLHTHEIGNIFEYLYRGIPIVIPINLNLNSMGHNIMGKGVAKDAKELFPILPKLIGASIKRMKSKKVKCDVFVYILETNKINEVTKQKEEAIILTFPTKFNHWNKADLDLIEEAAKILAAKFDRICSIKKFDSCAIPWLGCGEGGLDWDKQVKPILEKYLDERFIMVEYDPNWDKEDAYSV